MQRADRAHPTQATTCRADPPAQPSRLAAAALALLLAAGTSTAQLASHGPPNEFGFPNTYTDFDGLSLVQGTDPGDPLLLTCACDLPDPFGPLNVATGNFYAETFYWEANTDLVTSGGVGTWLGALEGIFLNETGAVVDGDQTVFSRVRIRIDVAPDPANVGLYTVTHPYGQETFFLTEADLGLRAINFTVTSIDLMGPGEEFTTPLDPAASPLGPTLLRWDANAPPGYIGNPNLPHTVTGSPFGTNSFRIQGPNIGGPGVNLVETPHFLVSGKLGVPNPTWTDLGHAMVGSLGEPKLAGEGTLLPETPVTLTLRNCLPNTAVFLVIGASRIDLPVKEGILVPSPDLFALLSTGPTGLVSVTGLTPDGVLSGVEVFFQGWVIDPAGPWGAVATNAISGVFP